MEVDPANVQVLFLWAVTVLRVMHPGTFNHLISFSSAFWFFDFSWQLLGDDPGGVWLVRLVVGPFLT